MMLQGASGIGRANGVSVGKLPSFVLKTSEREFPLFARAFGAAAKNSISFPDKKKPGVISIVAPLRSGQVTFADEVSKGFAPDMQLDSWGTAGREEEGYFCVHRSKKEGIDVIYTSGGSDAPRGVSCNTDLLPGVNLVNVHSLSKAPLSHVFVIFSGTSLRERELELKDMADRAAALKKALAAMTSTHLVAVDGADQAAVNINKAFDELKTMEDELRHRADLEFIVRPQTSVMSSDAFKAFVQKYG